MSLAWLCAAASGLLLVGAEPALPQSAGAAADSLALATSVEKVVAAAEGVGAALVRLDSLASGDDLVYTVTFTNTSGRTADHVRITNAIPILLRYVTDTAVGPGAEVLYSVDGGRTFGRPKELTVAAADGSRRTAEPGDYTHIRWLLRAPVEAGAKGFVRFRAIVR